MILQDVHWTPSDYVTYYAKASKARKATTDIQDERNILHSVRAEPVEALIWKKV